MKTVQKTLNQLVVGSNPTGVTVDNNSPEVYNKSLVSPEIAKSGDGFVPSPLFDPSSHGGDHA